ncbi:MAG: DUF2283 domain-containing protein [bacterium]
MKLHYYPDTDTLYIEFNDRKVAATDDLAEDVLVDRDANGALVGITFDEASKQVDLTALEMLSFPIQALKVA